MNKFLFPLMTMICGMGVTNQTYGVEQVQEQIPTYLYKIVSLDDWNKSQKYDEVLLTKDDAAFIHLAREDQLDRIVSKYWANVPQYIILKIETDQLPGRLVYEANPGGENKYYHLYDGSIPLHAIIETKTHQ